jgi:hypothetical protein
MSSQKCLEMAKQIVGKIDQEWKGDCTNCKKGKQQLKCNGKLFEIECSDCNGTGKMDGKSLYRYKLGKAVWCTCKKIGKIIHSTDGKKVFGNDTWICSSCGMVTQFG